MPNPTLIPFTPSNDSAPPFSAQITVAEGLIILRAAWNMAGQRWYIAIKNDGGETLLFRPLIGSPMNFDINLIRSISTSSLVYREDNQTLEVVV
ncbi:hypothetical protein [Saccharibacter floricola]|uniref:Uncharacterized protein n=1 Tax=Saccharibacter floricola DSM 15669 TaxID=1123227 RepID=A0ABQ0NZM6_9PROT|nr:hypothetical protein [Saccharibacter floricola]GBQ07503.1 hypothetical protein AA15669_1406 [Saccharibacter floricola DSM 15669]